MSCLQWKHSNSLALHNQFPFWGLEFYVPTPEEGWDFGQHFVRIKILPGFYIGEEKGKIDWTTLDIVEIKISRPYMS